MKCLRCGYCCIFYDVIIINPRKISESGEIDFTDDTSYMHKPSHEECPHLMWVDNKAHCSIHHLPWYSHTPCSDFTQIERSPEDPCRTGNYWRERGGFLNLKQRSM